MALHYLTKCFGREEKGERCVDNPYFRLAAPFVSSGGTERTSVYLCFTTHGVSFPFHFVNCGIRESFAAARDSDDDISDRQCCQG